MNMNRKDNTLNIFHKIIPSLNTIIKIQNVSLNKKPPHTESRSGEYLQHNVVFQHTFLDVCDREI